MRAILNKRSEDGYPSISLITSGEEEADLNAMIDALTAKFGEGHDFEITAFTETTDDRMIYGITTDPDGRVQVSHGKGPVLELRLFDVGILDRLKTAEERQWLNCYSVSRNYGGPEEGGWYYDEGRMLASLDVTGKTEEEIEASKAKLTEQFGWPKDNRQGRFSVNGGADFEIRLEGERGSDYPEERPHYE